MRILHIVTDLIRGGTEGQCARTAIALAQRNKVQQRVAVFFRQGYFLDAVEAACGPIHEIPIRRLLSHHTVRALHTLAQFIREESFDLVHTWDAEATLFGGLAARWTRTPLITSRRDLGEIYPRWKQHLLKAHDRAARIVVVNAEAIRERLLLQGLDAGKIVRIPNLIDLEPFDAATFPEAPPPPCPEALPPRLVCVARMDPEKNLARLIRAFALFCRRTGCGTLFLVGDGAERTSLQAIAHECAPPGRVIFLGERTDIPALLKTMHAGLLVPSGNEGLSNSILEYMAAALPVVCSDCGGNSELVTNGVNGLLVNPRDTEEICRALGNLMDEPLRKRMGRQGREHLERHFATGPILEQMEQLYASLA